MQYMRHIPISTSRFSEISEPEALRAFADYRMVAYAVVLILVMIFRPQGLLGAYDFSLSRWIENVMGGRLPWKDGTILLSFNNVG